MRKEEHRAAFTWIVERALLVLLVCAAAGAVITGCRGAGDDDDPGGFRITKFMIDDVEGIIDQNARTIEVTMPFGTNVVGLLPKIEFIGANIDPDPAWENPIDFTDPVKYTVYSKDGSAFAYMVTVTIDIPNTKEISSFDLFGVTSFSTDIIDEDEDTGVIMITVPYGTDISNRTTVITHSGDSINPVAGAPQNFEVPVTYEVYSLQGEKRVYTVNVTIAPNVENDITRFTLNGAEGIISGANIVVTLPYGTNLTSLTPVIETSPGSTVSPSEAQNFSNRVIYKVTAADDTTTRNYTVTVNVSAFEDKYISSFTIAGQEKSEISGNTITVTLPANMPKTGLAPTIAFTGNMVTPASGEERDFTSPVTYTVKSADNRTETYTVTVINAPAKNITFLSVAANGASWTTETTALTLQFDEDMGDALKADHIMLPGGITKGALTNNGLGEYELAVSDIPDNDVSISVTVAAYSVYGFDVAGSPKTTTVFKAPVEVAWHSLTADGVNKMKDTTELTLTFDKDVGLLAGDITLSGARADKGTLSPSGTTRTLLVSGITANNVEVIVSLNKTGFAFVPKSLPVTVYKELSTDATLTSLAVNGYTLSPLFDKDTEDYTVEVVSESIKITAEVNDSKAKLFYVENSNATITSGEVFSSKLLSEGTNTVTVKVAAEDGTTTKKYTLHITYSDFPVGSIIQDTFTVSKTEEWEDAVNTIKTGGNGQNYVIKVIEDFDVAGDIANTFGNVTDLIVVIKGSQTIGLSSERALLTVGPNQSIVLRDLTFKGWANNSESVVYIMASGKFEMRGDAKITGNASSKYGGVDVSMNGAFIMRDNASVFGNNATYNGGGVNVSMYGTFAMWDNASVFDNTAAEKGGGVYIGLGGTFTMWDNVSVSGNKAKDGGGVYIDSATFTMRDNVSVFSNTANSGGGVHLKSGTFRIAGGTVYGWGESSALKNTAVYSAALHLVSGTAESGTGGADGEAWVAKDTLSTTDDTIKVVNGVKQ